MKINVFFWVGGNVNAAVAELRRTGLPVKKNPKSIEVEGTADVLLSALGVRLPQRTGEMDVPQPLRGLCSWARAMFNGELIAEEDIGAMPS